MIIQIQHVCMDGCMDGWAGCILLILKVFLQAVILFLFSGKQLTAETGSNLQCF